MDQEVLVGLVDELVARNDNDRLAALAQVKHKAAAKAARTALHQLRSRKVKVEVPGAGPRQRGSGAETGRSNLPSSMATLYEPDWRRHVFMIDDAVGGSVNVYWGRISARVGLADLELLKSMTRKELRALLSRFREVVELVQVPRAEAYWLIADAADRCRATGHTLPSGYAAMTTMAGGAPGGGHPAEGKAPHPEADHEQLTALYEGEELRSWVPDQAFMQRMVMRLQEVSTSRLVLDEGQRRSRIMAVVDSAIEELFDEQGLAAGRRVMLDTAHLLFCKGDEERGSLFRAAADVFSLSPERAVVHPLVRGFLERLLNMDALLASMDEAPAPEAGEEPPEAAPAGAQENVSEGGIILPGGAGKDE